MKKLCQNENIYWELLYASLEIETFGINLCPEDMFIEIMKNKKEFIIAALGKYISNYMIKQYTSHLNNQQKQK